MAWSPDNIEAMRNILLNWDKLSAGDISILDAALKTPEATIGTIEGTANFVMWQNLERLSWAKRTTPPTPSDGLPFAPAFFVVTAEGRDYLPGFMERYDLRPGTFYKPKTHQAPAA